jgi:hypothetical protein
MYAQFSKIKLKSTGDFPKIYNFDAVKHVVGYLWLNQKWELKISLKIRIQFFTC